MPRMVTKADGTKVPFDKRKIVNTCIKAGASEEVAEKIAEYVDRTLEEGVSTHKIYRVVLEELEKRNPRFSSVAALREAIADLDAASFETFAARVLEQHGYKCIQNQIVPGAVVEHQIDVIAQRNGAWIVECKRHFNPHRFCGLDVALEVQARVEDLRDGFAAHKTKWNITGGWIFTNAKISEHAKRYADAKGIRLTGWHSGEFALEKLVEEKKAYPVTVLHIDLMSKASLLRQGIITLQDVLATKKCAIPNWPDIVGQATELIK